MGARPALRGPDRAPTAAGSAGSQAPPDGPDATPRDSLSLPSGISRNPSRTSRSARPADPTRSTGRRPATRPPDAARRTRARSCSSLPPPLRAGGPLRVADHRSPRALAAPPPLKSAAGAVSRLAVVRPTAAPPQPRVPLPPADLGAGALRHAARFSPPRASSAAVRQAAGRPGPGRGNRWLWNPGGSRATGAQATCGCVGRNGLCGGSRAGAGWAAWSPYLISRP
jgi:hypothetical protein